MSVFEKLPVVNVNTLSALVAFVDRIQQKVSVAFEKLEVKPQLPVSIVVSTGTVNTYQVTPSDKYLVVDSRGGPIKIVFPDVRSTQSVIVLNAYQGGAVTIVRANANPFNNGAAVITLDYNKTIEAVNSAKGWFVFGR